MRQAATGAVAEKRSVRMGGRVNSACGSACCAGVASHIQYMQKALIEMNLQLDHVLSDITGTTGLRIKSRVVRPLRFDNGRHLDSWTGRGAGC